MSLMEDLRAVAAALDQQFAPSSGETGPLLGALIAYNEHGDRIVAAAKEENALAAVTEVMAPSAPAPETTAQPAPAAPAPAPA
jgi:hypothetical protein